MDPTQIKPGDRASSLPVTADSSAEPYQRAATLMAGATAGSQGQVRVWGPSRRKLWITTGVLAVMLAIVPTLNITLPHYAVLWGYVCVFMCGAFVSAIAALYRPCYVTTDDAGIGITTWKGSRALRWTEIKSAESLPVGERKITLSLEAEDMEIILAGYPPAIQKELFSLIIARSGLCQHPVTRLHVRSDIALQAALAATAVILHSGQPYPTAGVRNEDPPPSE